MLKQHTNRILFALIIMKLVAQNSSTRAMATENFVFINKTFILFLSFFLLQIIQYNVIKAHTTSRIIK